MIAERGYLIPAINSHDTDYVRCAHQLAHSIRSWHPDANITILTVDQLPYGDQGGQANDWQVFFASPYRQTIKLEADMWCASPIDHWWKLFEHRDVVISTGCRDFYDTVSPNRLYRKFIDDNSLPDVYNAVTYWRLSEAAQEFFYLVRCIFSNWKQFCTILKFPDEEPTTDFVYAVAARILGEEKCTLPSDLSPRIVHMKPGINPLQTSDWTQELTWETTDPGLRINTVAQWGLVHYHIKDWQP